MNPERWGHVTRLFEAVHDLAPEARAELLARECADDAELLREVESLLDWHERAEGFLDAPAAAAMPQRIGPYEVVREIGRGGMGVVYEAIRRDQGFERRVAIKHVKRGMDTDFILARFERERRIVAGLEHPNIARVLDGGSTEEGRPFFVMELIEGKTILEYASDAPLDVRARLELFRFVCSAVQYAHQRLVIHRDIKPGNVLVTADGVPKLLDFGLAKVLAREGDLTRTRTELRLLTPEYASPEQVRGEELTTSTDVYSLGVLLYELLTGERPYRSGSTGGVEAAVLAEEPRRPSTVVPLHRDLDAIVLTALRKEPARRYASAEQLSEDLRRHLEGLPVRARPDTVGYRARKFMGRHRTAIAAAMLIASSLVAAAAVSFRQMRTARAERDRARVSAARAEETARFLVGLFQAANPVQSAGKTLTARELLDRGTERIARDLSGEPDVQASLLLVMANAYDRLSAFDRASALAEQSLAIREKRSPTSDVEIAESLHAVGRLRRLLGRPAQALPYLERATALREVTTAAGPELAETLRERAMALDDLGRGGEAQALLERAIAILERAPGEEARLALAYNGIAMLRHRAGDASGARTAYERSIASYEKAGDNDRWGMAMPLVNLGTLHREREELDVAETYFARTLAIDVKLFGAESTGTAYTLACLGDVAWAKGDLPRARELLTRSLDTFTKLLPEDHPNLAIPLAHLGRVALAEGRPLEARAHCERVLAMTEKKHGPEHPAVAEALVGLGRALIACGETERAEALLRRALAIERKQLPPRHRALTPTLTELGRALIGGGHSEGARPLLAEAVAVARERLPEGHSERREAEEVLRLAAPRAPAR